jgi:ADP-ribose pyrophosphatase
MLIKSEKNSLVWSGKYLSFFKEKNWEYVKRNNCTGIVIILAKTKEDKVLLVEQFRPPVKKRVIEYPAGLVNDQNKKTKESLLEAAKRELFEETGYKAKKIFKVIEGPVSSGLTADLVTFVMAQGLTKVGKGGGDKTENITIHEVELQKVPAWIKSKIRRGYLVDPKIYAGLYLFAQYTARLKTKKLAV